MTRTLQEKLTDEIDHAIHSRNTLEDSHLIQEVLKAVDRYTLNAHGVRPLAGLIGDRGLTWVGKFQSMSRLDAEDKSRGGL